MDTIAEHLAPISSRLQVPRTVGGLVTRRALVMSFLEVSGRGARQRQGQRHGAQTGQQRRGSRRAKTNVLLPSSSKPVQFCATAAAYNDAAATAAPFLVTNPVTNPVPDSWSRRQ